MSRNSSIILAKGLKIDKEHKNILNYSTSSMLSLLQSNDHYVASSNKYSFIRQSLNQIETNFSFGDCLISNYIAFQNPNYSNKWFFAFITNVIYISDAVTRIEFVIDEWATWYDSFVANQCFVEREHVNDDTTGIHTIPENLETGEYICNDHIIDNYMDDITQDFCYVMGTTSEPIAGSAQNTPAGCGTYNGIFSAVKYYRFDSSSSLDIILEIYNNHAKIDSITGIFIAPKVLAPFSGASTPPDSIAVAESTSPQFYAYNTNKQTVLDGYSPRNNKLLCHPFNFLLVSNNIGSSYVYNYEDFSVPYCSFQVDMALSPGCSIKIIPKNYKGCSWADDWSIPMGKLPICNFKADMYTNWLTESSVNIGGISINPIQSGYATSAFLGIAGLATGNPLALMGAGANIINTMQSQYEHKLVADQVRGNLNTGDVNYSEGKNTFHFYKMSIKQEYARIIDQYFDRYGYQVNTLKTPNLTGRTYWNFIKIAPSEDIAGGNITVKAMEEINNIFRKGTTVWHSHDNIGNYNLTNSITN